MSRFSRYIKIIFFLLFSLQVQLNAQTAKSKEDSLIALQYDNKLSPQDKVKIYEQLFYDVFFEDEAKAIRYNTILYSISKRYKINSGIGDYFFNIAFLKYSKSDFKSAIFYSKKASEIYYKDKNYDEFLTALARQCLYMKANGQIDNSLELAIKKIKQFNKYSKNAGLGELNQFVAEYYFDSKKFSKSIEYAKNALLVFQKAKHYNGIAECNMLIADIQYELENYVESIKYVNGINDLPDDLKNNLAYQIVYNVLMAKNYIKINAYKKSLHFSNKAIKLLKNSNFGLVVIETKLYKADALQKIGKNKIALEILLNLEKEIQNYLTEADVDKCLKYINEIKANIYIDNKQYNLALATLKKNLSYKQIDIETYKIISNLQYKIQLYKDAFETQRIYQNKKIEQLTENQNDNINELHVQYNVKENEFKIQNLKIKKLKNDLELKEQKEFSKSLIGIAILLLIVLGFVYNIYRIRNKVSQILNYKNKKLEVSNKKLIKSLKEKEILLKEVHHRVKNNLQLVSSILYIQANDTPNISVLDFLDLCQNRISSIALIHQNLYLTNNIESVDFQYYLKELSKTILDGISNKDFVQFEINTNNLRFNIQTSISLGLIITELISNSIKHAFKEKNSGIIYIEIKLTDNNKFELIFGDNGNGKNKKSNSSNSIGLELVELLVMQLNGKIKRLDNQSVFYSIIFDEIIE